MIDTDTGELERLRSQVNALEQLLQVHEHAVLDQSILLEDAMKQMNHQAEALKRSNAQLEEFAYVASHDLQEPLRKIQAFGERLRDRSMDRLDEKAQDYMMRMQNATVRMQQLINDLLTYSRLTTKSQDFVPLDLEKIVREVISDLEIRIEQNDARVDVEPLPTLEADPLQMRQLFQNLMGNALKFKREGVPPVLRVSSRGLAQAPDARGWHEISIADNGIGFEDCYRERIFGIFQRLHGRGEYEGTGIGLAVCKKIMERHHGTIRAESEPNVGTTFVLTLPSRHN